MKFGRPSDREIRRLLLADAIAEIQFVQRRDNRRHRVGMRRNPSIIFSKAL
jgi:hypothetical protein